MSGKVLNWAARALAGDVTAKCVLLILAEASDEKGETWIGQEAIAERCDIRRETVCGALKRLTDRGLVSRSKRRRSDGYRSSDLIRLTLCEAISREDNAHKSGSHVRLTGNLMCAKPDSRTPSKNPQIKDISSGKSKGEQSGKTKATYPDQFDTLWKAYPHFPGRSDKGASLKAWDRLSVEDRAALAEAVTAFSQTEQATKNSGQFVKGLHRWIANALWRDFVPSVPADRPDAIDWDMRLTSFKNIGAWLSNWGEKPGRDGCIVPAEALTRHDLGKPSTPVLKVVSGGAA